MTGTRAVQPLAQLVDDLVSFLETGTAAPGLFHDDVFCDFTLPLWRLQAQGRDDVVALRLHGHPGPGTVHPSRWEPTSSGFVIEFGERWTWEGEDWSSREMALVQVTDGTITELSVYCTGDWDSARRAEHASAVKLIRP